MPRHLSTVELYRAGEVEIPPYDLSEDYDRAIWTCLGLYVDHRERQETAGLPIHYGEPWEVEEYLKDLRDHATGERPMEADIAHDTAQAVAEALFTTGAGDTFFIPGEFWGVEIEDQPPEAPLILNRPVTVLSYMIRAAMGELISQAEVARRLGVSRPSALERIRSRAVPVLRVGRSVLVAEREVERLR